MVIVVKRTAGGTVMSEEFNCNHLLVMGGKVRSIHTYDNSISVWIDPGSVAEVHDESVIIVESRG